MEDRAVWRIVKWMCVAQLYNAEMDFLIWLYFGVLVPAWVLATLSLAYVAIIMGVIKK